MEGIFTLQYPEYAAAHELARYLPKAKGYSVCIPLTRQQKGFDLLVYEARTARSATVQVKSSRAYFPKPGSRAKQYADYDYVLWFKTFDIERPAANFYAFVGVYPRPTIARHRLSRPRFPRNWWSQVVLLLSGAECRQLMTRIRRSGERFFYISFDSGLKRIALTRGTGKPEPWEQFLLPAKAGALQQFLRR